MPLPVVHASPSAARRALLLVTPLPEAARAVAPSLGGTLWSLVWRLLDGHGLRVSEALRIDRASLSVPGRVSVAASKGSADRVLVDGELHGALAVVLATGAGSLGSFVTYKDVYAAALASGVEYRPPHRSKRRVTHSGRARHMQRLDAAGLDATQIAAAVGLRNPEVVTGYLS